MTTSLTAVVDELLPRLLRGHDIDGMSIEDIHFQPLRRNGRVGVEMHPLYTTEQTGAGGPAAALVRYSAGAASGISECERL